MPQSTQNPFDQFRKPASTDANPFDQFRNPISAEPDSANEADEGGVLDALWGGTKRTAGAFRNVFNIAQGDNEDVVAQAVRDSQIESTGAQEEFHQSLRSRMDQGDGGIWDGIKNVFGAAIDEPKGFWHEMVGQLPNTAAIMGTAAAGAAVGSAVPVFGTAVGGLVGAAIGMYAGNVGIETGFIAGEKAQDGDFTDADRSLSLEQGIKKGSTISAVDAATFGISRLVMGLPGRAVERAISKSLTDQGIDLTKDAILKAAADSPNAIQNAIAAGGMALEKTMTSSKRLGRGVIGYSLETVGEGTGEYAGSLAAGLEASPTDAVLESIMASAMSITELRVANKLTNPGINTQIVSDANEILENLAPATSVDEIIDVSEASINDSEDPFIDDESDIPDEMPVYNPVTDDMESVPVSPLSTEPVSELGTFTDDGVEFQEPGQEAKDPPLSPEGQKIADQHDPEIDYTPEQQEELDEVDARLESAGQRVEAVKSQIVDRDEEGIEQDGFDDFEFELEEAEDERADIIAQRAEVEARIKAEADTPIDSNWQVTKTPAPPPDPILDETLAGYSDEEIGTEIQSMQEQLDENDKEIKEFYRNNGTKSSLAAIVADLGGMEIRDGEAEGVKDKNEMRGGRWIFTKNGRGADALTEAVNQLGYSYKSANEFLAALDESIKGEKEHTRPGMEGLVELREFRGQIEETKLQLEGEISARAFFAPNTEEVTATLSDHVASSNLDDQDKILAQSAIDKINSGGMTLAEAAKMFDSYEEDGYGAYQEIIGAEDEQTLTARAAQEEDRRSELEAGSRTGRNEAQAATRQEVEANQPPVEDAGTDTSPVVDAETPSDDTQPKAKQGEFDLERDAVEFASHNVGGEDPVIPAKGTKEYKWMEENGLFPHGLRRVDTIKEGHESSTASDIRGQELYPDDARKPFHERDETKRFGWGWIQGQSGHTYWEEGGGYNSEIGDDIAARGYREGKQFRAQQEIDANKNRVENTNIIPVPYASGMSRPSDFEAALNSDAGIGVTATELSKRMIDEVVKAATWAEESEGFGKHIFIDSGVFSAHIKSIKTGGLFNFNYSKVMATYKSISDKMLAEIEEQEEAQLEKLLPLEMKMANVMMVMPDVIGDQTATIKLIKKWKKEINVLLDRGHEIVIPFQTGEMEQVFVKQEMNKLFDGRYVVGIPSNAKALSDKELANLFSHSGFDRIHILGAVQNKQFKSRLKLINTWFSDGNVGVTADANIMRGSLNQVIGLPQAERKAKLTEILNKAVPEELSGSGGNFLVMQTEDSLQADADNLADPNSEGAKAETKAKIDAEVDLFVMTSPDQQVDKPSTQGGLFGANGQVSAPAEPKAADESTWGKSNKVFSEEQAEKDRAALKAALNQLNSGLDPALMAAAIRLAGFHMEAGARKFAEFSAAMLDDIGVQIKPYLRQLYESGRYAPEPGFDVSEMSSPAEIEEYEANYVPSTNIIVESDIGEYEAQESLGENGVPVEGEGAGDLFSQSDAGIEQSIRTDGSSVVSDDGAAIAGTRSNNGVHNTDGSVGIKGGITRSFHSGGSSTTSSSGQTAKPSRDEEADAAVEATRERQARTNKRPTTSKVIPADLSNVAATVPQLLPEQQEDVVFAETRLDTNKGRGVMFTNGTGTGKTFTGLGIIKRKVMAGKENILIVVPNAQIAGDWQKAGLLLDLDIKKLKDTTDNGGSGQNITTYANFYQNMDLIERQFDAIVFDESQTLGQKNAFEGTRTNDMARALTGHPRGKYKYHQYKRRELYEEQQRAMETIENLGKMLSTGTDQEAAEMDAEIDRLSQRMEDIRQELMPLRIEDEAESERRWAEYSTDVVYLSATPFAYRKSIDLAEGFLFDYGEGSGDQGYNAPDAREQYFITNFGYRMKNGKLNEPDAKVNTGLMERSFNDNLRKSGAVRARILEVEKDYDRKFYMIDGGIGIEIDDGMQWVNDKANEYSEQSLSKTASPEQKKEAKYKAESYRSLSEMISGQFDYLHRAYLLESLKAKAAIPIIKKHISMGRQVVVFHGFNKGGGFHPFQFGTLDEMLERNPSMGGWEWDNASMKYFPAYKEFLAEAPQFHALDFSGLQPPLQQFEEAFGDKVGFVNGTVLPVAKRRENIDNFNDDNSDLRLLVVQEAAGSAGISLHDTTGKHQRVTINISLPVKPTTSIQEEGRTYRTFVQTDAIQRYMSTGLNMERWAVASKLAERAVTAENLAMGNQARGLKDSFIQAYEEADIYAPGHADEGKGGKVLDRELAEVITPFSRAKTYYYGQQKTQGRRDQRAGKDYFATPEPLGLKMVEWAQLEDGERVLEPSAGHGAILRFMNDYLEVHYIEPSSFLASQAALTTGHATHHGGIFESLDIHNKYDAVVMNPPFGAGGADAVRHVEKAMTHVSNGGRVVALVPKGPAADKRFEKMLNDEKGVAKDFYMVSDITLPTVTFERAGTKVSARVIVLEKQVTKEGAAQVQQSNRDYSGAEDINEFFDRIEESEIPKRIEVVKQDPKTAKRNSRNLEKNQKALSDLNPDALENAEFEHTQTGDTLYAVKMNEQFPGDEFQTMKSIAKKHDGYYSRYNKAPAVAGFLFKSAETRDSFLAEVKGQPGTLNTRLSRPLSDINISEQFEVEGTGELVSVSTTAEKLVQDVDGRIDELKKLISCLKAG